MSTSNSTISPSAHRCAGYVLATRETTGLTAHALPCTSIRPNTVLSDKPVEFVHGATAKVRVVMPGVCEPLATVSAELEGNAVALLLALLLALITPLVLLLVLLLGGCAPVLLPLLPLLPLGDDDSDGEALKCSVPLAP